MLGVTVIDKLGLNNSAAVNIIVGQSALRAAIDGGDRNVGVSETLTLNAGTSNDPDMPDGGATDLLFEWSCEVPVGPGTCGGRLAPTVSNDQVSAGDDINHRTGRPPPDGRDIITP